MIEDEIPLADSVETYLKSEGYVCERVSGAREGLFKIQLYMYDCILLDIGLPDGNGLELIATIKKNQPATGIIIISARGAIQDKVTGLDLGADDYLAKPFHLPELNARIRSLVRRRQFGASREIIFNEIVILPEEGSVFVDKKALNLTRKEFEILLFLIVNKNRLLKKESIAEHVWGDNIDAADNFDFIYTHLKNLRKKISDAGGRDYIQSFYGIGYKFTDLNNQNG